MREKTKWYAAAVGLTTAGALVLTAGSGRHVIVAVRTVANTTNAFYACSDVTF